MDWSKLLSELRAWGWTQVQIGAECGASQATVSALQRGTQPATTWEIGDKILRLHARVKGEQKLAAPPASAAAEAAAAEVSHAV
jgi:transcriptional regulator